MTKNVSRRSVAKGAAWAVPAAVVSAAAPAFAVSNKDGYVGKIFYGTGGANAQRMSVTICAPKDSDAVFTINSKETPTFDSNVTKTSAGYLVKAGTCGALNFDDSADKNSQSITPNTNVTVSSGNYSLSWKVPQRFSGTNQINTAMVFTSKSGTSCYPEVRYSAWSPSNAGTGSNGSRCAKSSGNNTSTFYPDGSCAKLNITGGQASIPAKCD